MCSLVTVIIGNSHYYVTHVSSLAQIWTGRSAVQRVNRAQQAVGVVVPRSRPITDRIQVIPDIVEVEFIDLVSFKV